jgi:hypothetical protein
MEDRRKRLDNRTYRDGIKERQGWKAGEGRIEAEKHGWKTSKTTKTGKAGMEGRRGTGRGRDGR